MKRLLVIRFSALGDVAMLVPVIHQLAITFPDWQVTILSRKQVSSLFDNMPTNVLFYGADLKGKHKGIKGLNRLLHDIHYEQFDAVADMHDVLRTKWICWRMKLNGMRVASIRKGRLEKWLLTHTHYKKALPTSIQRYMDVLHRLGFDSSISISSSKETLKRVGFGIAPFAAHKGKIYPLEKMETIVQEIDKIGEPIYLFGAGQKEKTILDQWAKKYKNAYSLVGKHTLPEEIEIMRHLRCMITMDSANLHLASIAGTRVLSIWGATHPNAGFTGWGQNSEDCIQREDLPCRPCSIYGNKKCKFSDYRCLSISPQTIIERVYAITQS